MSSERTIYPLMGTVQPYAWGGSWFIPSIISSVQSNGKPLAEYWLGAHPSAPSSIITGSEPIELNKLISSDPVKYLGKSVQHVFGKLPYLLKLLDVKDMLSIQVHPSKAAAKKDFTRENTAGIPLDSPERNYKDDNHKPELMVAMGDFWLLHGFKPESVMKKTLAGVPELRSLLPVFEQSGYSGLYEKVMAMPQEEVNDQLKPLIDRTIPLYQDGKLDKANADYWAAKAAVHFSQPGKTDRGIFSVYLFNLVHLKRGEGIFQDAGVPHAYLEGQNVEIMASSDNVLRGGLTTKHIDVKELLKHTRCEATEPSVLTGKKSGLERIYKTPAPDFELSLFDLETNVNASFTPVTAEILLLSKGEVGIYSGSQKIIMNKDLPATIVFAGQTITVSATVSSSLFRATVPV